MNFMRQACVCAATAALLAGSVAAMPSRSSARATVPFEFAVNGQVLPAGVYSISVPDDSGMVEIRGETSRVNLLVLGGRNGAFAPADAVRLVFVKKNGRMHLSEVQAPAPRSSATFPVK